jgi:aminoglycoside phosphotransferase (APT) family kinase protein
MAAKEPSTLSQEAVKWVLDFAGENAEIQRIRPVIGGTSSVLYEFTVHCSGEAKSFILRLFTDQEWLEQEPDLARHEAESLEYAGRGGLSAPRLIAYDETGEKCGVPATLMTKVAGAVSLQPKEEHQWLDGMAEVLAKIHRLKGDAFPFEYFSYNDALTMDRPLWSKVQEEWMRAFYIVAGIRPPTETCFIHRDFHPANVLWEDGAISGVVDWVNACRGPRGIDVGHCRVNLAQLYGLSIADRFLEAYQRHAGGQFSYHPYWDLLSLTDILDGPPSVYAGWAEFGISGLSDELIRHRLDEYLLSLLDRFDDY